MARANRKDRGLFTYTLADGTVCYGVRVWRLGVPITKKGFSRKSAARQWYEDRRRDILNGRPLTNVHYRLTLAQLLTAYLATATQKKNYRGECEYSAWWSSTLGKQPATAITPVLIDQARTALLKRPVAPATVNRYVAWLHHAYQWGIDRSLVAENPCRLFVRSSKKGGQRLHERPAPEQVWTDTELTKLSEKLGAHILVPLVALLTGLRQDEQFSLRKDRIDWDRQCAILEDPKAGVSQIVYLNADALAILRYQAAQSGDSPFLYPSPRWPMTKPMSGKAWYALYFKPSQPVFIPN